MAGVLNIKKNNSTIGVGTKLDIGNITHPQHNSEYAVCKKLTHDHSQNVIKSFATILGRSFMLTDKNNGHASHHSNSKHIVDEHVHISIHISIMGTRNRDLGRVLEHLAQSFMTGSNINHSTFNRKRVRNLTIENTKSLSTQLNL